MWKIVFTKQARKDAQRIDAANLRKKAEEIINILKSNPYQSPPSLEKLKGDLCGSCSRKINIHHRIVYQIVDELRTIKIIRMWTHYE